ncbi:MULTISPECIES: hypothetical protein [unclassified Pseudomonas]|uniref:hypothetical protein n=1 Tax=unclassified Pseudomonas TaxID=196821 RepID=UPI002AC8B805|nr:MULTISPECIES: hypothetical protein [unclassified Pseudomonas]MEB0043187.1 hypothetical protein [Pseudomonas sp. MH10]MEB0076690.1 hypothetical protein [Pseudomonas sp. MH10out]MEB0090379.1 hypothetical protein [Pseudomonas sp. CCI4.2]MEB0100778.1 hypothetical protein [Pseudomonas sp. CCI3.2]MEB0120782.1 hypothetical protein [Pseudomonas sp. CCI1.2]
MAESQRPAVKPELYERLINRIGLALDVAKTAVRLRHETPTELELRGLSPAEFELIEAYLDKGTLDLKTEVFGFKTEGMTKDACFAKAVDGPASAPRRSAKVIWLEDHKRSKASMRGKSLYFR